VGPHPWDLRGAEESCSFGRRNFEWEKKEVQKLPAAFAPSVNDCVPTKILLWVSLIFEKPM